MAAASRFFFGSIFHPKPADLRFTSLRPPLHPSPPTEDSSLLHQRRALPLAGQRLYTADSVLPSAPPAEPERIGLVSFHGDCSIFRPIAMSASSSGSGLHTSHELSLPRTSLQSGDLSLDTKSSCHDGSFPTSFHSASKRSVRRHLLPHSTDLSQGGLPATPSEKKRMAPSSSDCFPTEFHLPALRQVRRRICTDPAEPHRVNSNLPAKRRPKQPILENTDAFPTDFQFSGRRHAQPRRLQKSSGMPNIQPLDLYEYLQPQTSFDTQSWQEHKSQLVAGSGANASAVSTFAHRHINSNHSMMIFDIEISLLIFGSSRYRC
ncbi:hypothetical protein EJB05_27963, partial [Eragrostis curvula]